MKRIHLAQDRKQWLALMNMVINVFQKGREFLD